MTPPSTPSPSKGHSLTPEQWQVSKDLFLEAVDLPPPERAAFLESRCPDPAIRAYVLALLAHDERESNAGGSPETTSPSATPTPTPGPEPAREQTVGSFKLLSLLGEGATGLVYLAEQSSPRRQVAVKIMRPGLVVPATLKRLEREAEIMARLRHPGIAHVIESGADPAGPYVAMEYVKGEPITRFAARLTLSERLDLFLRVCDAVQHAHSMGVIHRDLKPANILVGADATPKILDFGVARVADLDARHATLISTRGQLVGTLAYMSPEQAAGDPDSVDARADIYALGVILYELLAGTPPLDIDSKPLPDALRMIANDAPPRLGAIVRACRGDLETIVGKALEKSPERRYNTVAELAGDVRRHMSRLPILARPPSALYEFTRFAQRRRPLVAGVAVALLAIVATLAWSLAAQRRQREDYLIVRAVAGSWLADVMNNLAPVPGTYEARRRMLTDLRAPLERFAQRHPTDLDVQANLAALEFASADLDREAGNLASAMTGFARSFEILSRLVARQPHRAKWRLQHAVAAVKVGDVLRGRGRAPEAIAWYQAALALDFASARDFNDNYTAHDQLVWSFHRLAHMAADQQDYGAALRYVDRMEEAAALVNERWPNAPAALWCRIGAMQMKAHIALECGHHQLTREMRQQVMELGRKLVDAAPSNRGYVVGQVFALANESHHLMDEGDLDAAEVLLAEARPLVRRTLDLDGHDRISHDTAVAYYSHLRRLHELREDEDPAIEAAARAAWHARCAVQVDPASGDAARDLLRTQSGYLDLLMASRRHRDPDIAAAACDLRDDAFRILARLPEFPDAWATLARLSMMQRATQARDLALARLASEKLLEIAGEHNPYARALLAKVHEQEAVAQRGR